MGAVTSCLSNIMYVSEKIVLYSTCVALVSTIILMFLVTLGMGIGLGYNYCFVDMKTKYKYIPGHESYPENLRFPYHYRRFGEEQPEQAVVDKAAIEDRENEKLRYPVDASAPGLLNVDKPSPKNGYSVRGTRGRVSTALDRTPTTPSEYYGEILEDYSNVTVPEVEMFVETQVDNYTLDTNDTESTENVVIVDLTETEEITDSTENTETTETIVIAHTTETIETTEIKTDDVYTIDEPTPEPVSPDEKRRVKKLVIPISGLDLVSLLSKLSDEKNNHSLQIVTT